MLKEYGFVRVGAASNKIVVANVEENVKEIINCLDNAQKNGVEILCFSELSLTGCSCCDLFLTDDLLKSTLKGIKKLTDYSKNCGIKLLVEY